MKAIIEEAEVDPQGWLKDIESRSQVKRTLCGNGQMVWHIWGEGVPIVFLHGGHGDWSHWCRNVEQIAAEGFKVIVADLPGLGASDDPGPPYTAEGIAEIVYYGITSLLPENSEIDLVGFSFGSVIGAVVAEKLDIRLKSFNVVGAAGFGPRERIANSMVKIHKAMSEEERIAAAQNNMRWLMLAHPENVGELATEGFFSYDESRPYAVWSARTASSVYSDRISTLTFISEVDITSMLMPFSPSVLNIVVATPG